MNPVSLVSACVINWDLAGKARSKCVTNVGHKVQLPLGPSTSDASANWDLAGKARSKCVTDVGHEVQLPLGPSTRLCLETIRYKRGHNVLPPLGPSTDRLSEKLGFGG